VEYWECPKLCVVAFEHLYFFHKQQVKYLWVVLLVICSTTLGSGFSIDRPHDFEGFA